MNRSHAFLPGAAILIALVSLVLLMASPSASQATTFNPTLVATIDDPTPGVHSDVTYDFQIHAPDANFSDIVSFLPPEFDIAANADVPVGAVAGELRADATFGLLNSACVTSLPVEMTLYEASTNFDDIWSGAPDSGYYDNDGNGIPEFAQHTPYFMSNLFGDVQPLHRIYGQAYIASTWNMVNFVVFDPGAPLPFLPKFDESLGYPMFAILNDPRGQIYINPISDFCTPLGVTTTVYGTTDDNAQMPGEQGGHPLLTNPTDDGTYIASSFVRSLWDADNDGIESNLDPCRYTPDTVWDPRTSSTAGDDDKDGLPAVCDPDDHSFNQDQDGDGYVNRLDFCPFTPDFAFDRDGDDVGDACDRAPYDASDGGLSHRHTVCTTSLITIGAGGDTPNPLPCPDGPDRPIFDFLPPPPIAGVSQQVAFHVVLYSGPNGGIGVPDITINFTVEGANPGNGVCITTEENTCTFSYVGNVLGEDTITASVPQFDLSETATVSWQEPPDNDLFQNANVIDGLPYEDMAETYLSGREASEPDCGYSNLGSVWYQFTPDEDAMIELAIEGTDSAAIGVFTGDTLGSLSKVYCEEPVYGGDSAVSPAGFFSLPSVFRRYFEVEAGQTYHISVSAYTNAATEPEITVSLDTISGISVGDMNCDNDVNVVDALIVLRLDAGLSVPDCASAYGDVTCDGIISPLDALFILFYDAHWNGFTGEIPGCPPIGWSG